MDEIKPSRRLREPTKEDVHNIAKIRELCTEWGKDAENYINRYLNITAQGGVLSRDLDRTVQILADYLICRDSGPAKPQQTSLSVERAARAPSPKITGPATLGVYQGLRKLGDAATSATQKPKPIAAPALAPCSIEELKAAFTAQRSSRKMTHSDMAGILGLSNSAVGLAERSLEKPWAIFFQSQQVIRAYAGNDSLIEKELTRKAHAAFYPQGIRTLQELVRCVAYKQGFSIDDMGAKIGIKYLAAKLNPESTHAFRVDDQIALRTYLSRKIKGLAALGISNDLIDTLLPDPRKAVEQPTYFAAELDRWALLSSGSKGAFVAAVAEYQHRTLAHNAHCSWGLGRGLSNNLEAIIHVLKTSPNTKDIFPEYEQRFRDLAATVMKKPRHPREGAGTLHVERATTSSANESLGRQ